MTVAELISELQQLPNPNARVMTCMRSVVVASVPGEYVEHQLAASDASEVDEVRNEGPFVCVWAR